MSNIRPGPKPIHRITLEVVGKHLETTEITRFDLADPEGWPLPPFSGGAHIDLHLPGGLVRQYSLCGDPEDATHWSIAVLREANGRGGSQAISDAVQLADTLLASLPRNAFPLADAPHHLMIAGGIGITPFLPMLAEANVQGTSCDLIYLTRSPERTALLDAVVASGANLTLHHSQDGRLDLAEAIANAPSETQVYCCGPTGLIEAVQACAPSVQVEWFGAHAMQSPAYEVEIAGSGVCVPVAENQTMLDALRLARIIHQPNPISSGREGLAVLTGMT